MSFEYIKVELAKIGFISEETNTGFTNGPSVWFHVSSLGDDSDDAFCYSVSNDNWYCTFGLPKIEEGRIRIAPSFSHISEDKVIEKAELIIKAIKRLNNNMRKYAIIKA